MSLSRTSSSFFIAAGEGWRAAVLVGAIALALLLPAFWNRYPLLYYDSLDYATMPFIWRMPVYRTGAYGVFALTAREVGSIWGAVVAQSVIVAYVLYEAWRLFAAELRLRGLFLMTAVLIVLTGLPWATSQLMPDAFSGAAVLAVLILGFHAERLGRWRQVALVAILAIASAVHPTHLALLVGLMLCMAAMTFLARRGWRFSSLNLKLAALGLLIGVCFSVASNWAMTGRFFLAPRTTATLTLAVLVQDGLAKRYLNEVCPEPAPRKPILCPYRNDLPNNANAFLWHNQSFWDLDGWYGFETEAPWMVGQIIKRYPLEFAWTALKLMGEQLVTLQTGEGLEPMQKFIGEAMQIFYPREVPAFLAARQQTIPDATFLPLERLNAVQVPLALACVALLPLLAWLAYRRRDKTVLTVACLLFLLYLGNAFLCGAVSNPADRYGSRIAWLAVWAMLWMVPRLRSSRVDEVPAV